MSLDIRVRLQQASFTLNAEFTAPGSGVTALFGPSGCGKTSLLRAIAGLNTCQSAYICINGQCWHNDQSVLPTHKRQLAYVFQEANLFSHLSVQKNLFYGLNRAQKKTSHSKTVLNIDDIIDLLGIRQLLPRDTLHLSGGERQRVAIARALLSQPQLLLMDEPLAALDYNSKLDILPYLERLHTALSLPILYVSHSIDEVIRLADYLIVLKQGHVETQGKVEQVLNSLNSPLNQVSTLDKNEPLSVLPVIVKTARNAYDLSELQLSTQTIDHSTLYIPYADTLQNKQQVRLRISARDVSITLHAATDSSILNILPVTIQNVDTPRDYGQRLISLSFYEHTLLALISEYSYQALKLKPGMQVFAQIKALALL